MRQDYFEWRQFYIKHAKVLSAMVTARRRRAWQQWKIACPTAPLQSLLQLSRSRSGRYRGQRAPMLGPSATL